MIRVPNLFGPEVRKKITERANTIEAFNKQFPRSTTHLNHPHNHQLAAVFIQGPDHKVRRRIGQKLHSVQKVPPTQHKLQKQSGKLSRTEEVSRSKTQGLTTKEQLVGGILRSHLPAWHQITDNPWVLQCIQGYNLEFGDTLPPDNCSTKQPTLSPEQTQILDQEIESLLQKNAIESAPGRQGFFSPMFIVPKKDGGWRPIINLKQLNTFLEVPHFKMEGISTLKDVLQKNDFMGKIDLKDAYLTVTVCPQHRKFLKFQWKGQNYQFKSLPFGLATAPGVYTKILRPLAAKLRKQGICIIIYLDVILIMAQTKDLLRSHMGILAQELESLGFKSNHNKCVWTPTQTIEYLGFSSTQ